MSSLQPAGEQIPVSVVIVDHEQKRSAIFWGSEQAKSSDLLRPLAPRRLASFTPLDPPNASRLLSIRLASCCPAFRIPDQVLLKSGGPSLLSFTD